ncbi:MAG: formylmethanofuran dehydrogenase subunit C [Pirellulaceae bacterium]
MTLRIELKVPLPNDIEGSGLIRNWMPALTASQVLEQPLQIGNVRGEFGDLFRAAGDYADQCSLWSGDFSLLTGLAACQNAGQTIVEGNIGHRAGAKMQGGSLIIRGNGANDIGSSMMGGTIFVTGNTGDRTGGCGSGDTAGMNRGTIIVAGNCGEAVGLRMRRGMIWVGGSALGYAGFQLIAGTVIVGKSEGVGLAHEMKRGTVVALRTNADAVSSIRFRTSGTVQGGIIAMLGGELRRGLQAIGESIPETFEANLAALQRPMRRFTGDCLQDGSGELLFPV